ncbi:MAG TPA: enolase C-terminal domain-like protein, partial [Burkholderiaceae bacterium]|nr:enolase C-terminal domain-like protein [Burkholderiaceae bacterium]
RPQRAGMARLAARFVVPIMADEALRGPDDALEIARLGAADVLALKIAKSGGLHGVIRTAAVGDAAGMALYGGTMLEGSIGSIASAHAFSCLPRLAWGTELFGPLLLKADVVVRRPDYSEFSMSVPTGPGLGVELDEDKLAHYRRSN